MSTTDLVLIIGVVTTSIVTIIQALRSNVRERHQDARTDLAAATVAEKAEQVAQKLDHITVLTNSTLTAALKRNTELEAMIERLNVIITEKQDTIDSQQHRT